jgi:hypothetical protein
LVALRNLSAPQLSAGPLAGKPFLYKGRIMKTEIQKSYKWGFVLSEQELRRIFLFCRDNVAKITADQRVVVEAKLKDGSIIEADNIDQILANDNGGQKELTRLSLQWDQGKDDSPCRLKIIFQSGQLNPKSWDSIFYEVTGNSRDAVFVLASDLDDRLQKTKIRSWPYIVSRPWFIIIPIIISMVLVVSYSGLNTQTHSAIDALEQAYKSGKIVNPIESLIFYERAKLENSSSRFLIFMLSSFLIPFFIVQLFSTLYPKFSMSYVFYWGDLIGKFDKRKNLQRIFWIVIVLGVIASIIAGLFLRLF